MEVWSGTVMICCPMERRRGVLDRWVGGKEFLFAHNWLGQIYLIVLDAEAGWVIPITIGPLRNSLEEGKCEISLVEKCIKGHDDEQITQCEISRSKTLNPI